MKKKLWKAAMGLGTAVCLLGGMAVSASAADISKDTVVIFSSNSFEPFVFTKDGELTGYDVDIWNEIAERTGTTVEWSFVGDTSSDMDIYTTAIMQSMSGGIDVIALQGEPDYSTMPCTEPVAYFNATAVVPGDNTEIQTVDALDLSRVALGASAQLVNKGAVGTLNDNLMFSIRQNLSNGDGTDMPFVNSFENITATGAVDAIVTKDILVEYALKENPDLNIRQVENYASSAGCYEVPDETLLNEINAVLGEMKADGTMKTISEKWFGRDVSLEE